MARKVQIILTDDLTDEVSDDVQTITFALDGTSYEIDLNGENAVKMRDTLTRYVKAARRVKGGTAKASNKQTSSAQVPADYAEAQRKRAIRKWAEETGALPAGSRGRLAADVIEKYEAAHKSKGKAKASA